MKMSRACSGMLPSENDDFKFLKTAKSIKCTLHHGHHSSRGSVTVVSLQISLWLTRNMNLTVARAVLYIFRNIETLILVTFHRR